MSLLASLAAMIEAEGRAALVTLARVAGSSPREEGARMAVRPDGAFSGTIGGGALEWQALGQAQALLARSEGPTLRMIDVALGPDLGQCCGGRVRVAIERLGRADLAWLAPLAALSDHGGTVAVATPTAQGHFVRRPATGDEAALLPSTAARLALPDGRVIERFGTPVLAVILFGAGHVGRALALALAPLPVAVTWVDARPQAFPPHVPANAAASAEPDPQRVLAHAPDGACVLAMTHSHALDLDIVAAALAMDRFALVGAIGSATKRARFVSRLRQAGLPEPAVAAFACPIGVPGIGGKEPAVIAASVAAQLLQVRARGLVRDAGKNAAPDVPAFSRGAPSPNN